MKLNLKPKKVDKRTRNIQLVILFFSLVVVLSACDEQIVKDNQQVIDDVVDLVKEEPKVGKAVNPFEHLTYFQQHNIIFSGLYQNCRYWARATKAQKLAEFTRETHEDCSSRFSEITRFAKKYANLNIVPTDMPSEDWLDNQFEIIKTARIECEKTHDFSTCYERVSVESALVMESRY